MACAVLIRYGPLNRRLRITQEKSDQAALPLDARFWKQYFRVRPISGFTPNREKKSEEMNSLLVRAVTLAI